ncbi:hypothetical protein EVAR_12760_1 [Eumeta japonica]|uniref:Uncharacterized protein n=1 Tax=Eumeta variegata TaxID=151549 RepID=A0A4C1UBG7_EUMVA|nr:hypothetical protein EVAR_12760_1 [Eumeta japonica]
MAQALGSHEWTVICLNAYFGTFVRASMVGRLKQSTTCTGTGLLERILVWAAIDAGTMGQRGTVLNDDRTLVLVYSTRKLLLAPNI